MTSETLLKWSMALLVGVAIGYMVGHGVPPGPDYVPAPNARFECHVDSTVYSKPGNVLARGTGVSYDATFQCTPAGSGTFLCK